MISRKFSISSMCLFLLVVLPIYQDSPLSKYLGAAGYTLIMPLSLFLFVIHVLFNHKISINTYIKKLLNLGGWMLLVSIIAIVIWGRLNHTMYAVGEFLPIKAIKVWLQYISYPIYVYLLLFYLKRSGIKYLFKYAFVVFIILGIIAVIEMQTMPYAFETLHFAGEFPYYRIRLLTMESSATASMIYIYALLSFYYSIRYNHIFCLVITSIITVFLFATTGSKTLMISIGLSIIVYVLIAIKKLNRKRATILIALGILSIVVVETILPTLMTQINVDIKEYTSVATRTYTFAISCLIGLVFPFGVGGAVYLPIFQEYLLKHIDIINNLSVPLNTSEIYIIARNTTDKAVTVKSGIMQFNLYWGILGTIYLISIFVKLGKAFKKNNIIKGDLILVGFISIILLLVMSLNFSFDFWILFAVVVYGVQNADL